jgi:hypothetical protein
MQLVRVTSQHKATLYNSALPSTKLERPRRSLQQQLPDNFPKQTSSPHLHPNRTVRALSARFSNGRVIWQHPPASIPPRSSNQHGPYMHSHRRCELSASHATPLGTAALQFGGDILARSSQAAYCAIIPDENNTNLCQARVHRRTS